MSASTLRIVYKAKASSLLPSSSNTAKNYISNGKKTPKFYSSSFFVIVIFGLSNNVKFMFLNRNIKATLHIMYWLRTPSRGTFVLACFIGLF